MRALVCVVLSVAVLSCYSTPAFAWGRKGHRIVATIAEQNISDQTHLRIKQILGGGVTLADVANYADDVRDQHPETYNYHFVDIPIDNNVNDDEYKPSRDCKMKPKGDCVLAALSRYRDKVLSPSSTPEQRADALKFIIHLVGDMHQPLHCAERNNDGGGGGVSVTWFTANANLHSVWDSLIIDRPHLSDAKFVQGLINGSTAQERAEMREGNILQWALEAHRIAGESAYKLPHDNKLGTQYYNDNWPLVHRQLLRGGMRLARVLDWLFAPHTGPNSDDPLLLVAVSE